VVGFGYEAGNWLKLAVTADVEAYEKVGRSHHPEHYAARVVLWADDKVYAEMVLARVLRICEANRQVLNGSCVSLPVAAVRETIERAAIEVGVVLRTETERAAAVEDEMRRGWR
jgi:hypothetical protein